MIFLVYTAMSRPANPWAELVTNKYFLWLSAAVAPVIDFFRYWVEREHDFHTIGDLATKYTRLDTYATEATHYLDVMKAAFQATPDVSNMRVPTQLELMLTVTFISVFLTIGGQIYTVFRYLRRNNKTWWEILSAMSKYH